MEHEELDVEESATWAVMIVGGRAGGVGLPKGSVGERAWSNMSGGALGSWSASPAGGV